MASTLCPVVIGRDVELGAVEAALAAARMGRGGLTLVLGEAGVGKSRLVAEAAAVAERGGVTVLSGRAVEAQSPVPFWPLSHALMAKFRACGPPEVPELRPLRGALGRLVPEWRDESLPGIDDTLVLVAEALVRLLSTLAGEGVCLLVLEDLEWADAETLTVAEYLAENLRTERVVCLATLRDELSTPALLLARSLTISRLATTIELDRLDAAGIEAMARSCLRVGELPPELAPALRDWTDGVPLLVEELLAAWVASGVLRRQSSGEWSLTSALVPVVPSSFAHTVRCRLEAQGPDAGKVLRAAAVLGRRFDLTLVAAVTGLAQPIVLEALRACMQAQLVADEPEHGQPGFTFRHAMTRDAILGELLTPERVELAGRALHAVEVSHPTLAGPWCELAAELAEVCGEGDRAARLLIMSARRALAQGALVSAEAALERARALGGDPDVALAADEVLTEVLSLAGKVEGAVEAGSRLLAACQAQSATPARLAEVTLRLARALATSGAWERAEVAIDRARALGQGLDSPCLLARVDALAAHVALGQGHLDQATGLAGAALAVAETSGLPEVACEALEVIGRRARLRDLGEAEAAFDRSRQIAEDHALTLWRMRALHELASIDVLSSVRLDRLTAARDLPHQAGALATAAHLDLHLASVLSFHFDAAQGLAAARRCEQAARRFHLGPLLAMAQVREAQCHAISDDAARMEEAIAEAIAASAGDVEVNAGVWGQCRATLSLLSEHRGRALAEMDVGASCVRDRPEALPWTFRSLWALLRTIEDLNGEGARREVAASGITARPFHRAVAGYADAVALGRMGDRKRADATFAAAETEMAALCGRGGYGHLARRLVAECALEDGWGDPAVWLREAVVFFEERAHDQVGGACRTLLRDAGVALPRRQRSDTAVPSELRALGLTARELDVLALVAARLSNREIGVRLYVSHRTVDKHVQHLLAKTGTQRRADLIGFAVRSGVAPPRP